MTPFEVRVGSAQVASGSIAVSAQLRSPTRRDDELRYEIRGVAQDAVVTRGDPFVVAALVLAMREGCDLHVRGAPVSASLLRNLDEFQQIWHAWFGHTVVDLVAEEERDDAPPAACVVAFSGGVDSAFSAYSHAMGVVRRGRDVRAGLMIHGMDIPCADTVGFDGALTRSRRMLASLDLDVISVKTNAWELLTATYSHFPGLGVASALHVVGGGFGAGLLPSTADYAALALPLDSNPMSDWLLGGSSFAIVHDGAAYNRLEKIRRLASWDEATENLRVCLREPRHDRNCGRCRKCLLTLLEFHVLGIEPRCFDAKPSAETVVAFAGSFSSHPVYVAEMQAIVEEARRRRMHEQWMRAARRRLRVIAARRALTEVSPTFSDRAARAVERARARFEGFGAFEQSVEVGAPTDSSRLHATSICVRCIHARRYPWLPVATRRAPRSTDRVAVALPVVGRRPSGRNGGTPRLRSRRTPCAARCCPRGGERRWQPSRAPERLRPTVTDLDHLSARLAVHNPCDQLGPLQEVTIGKELIARPLLTAGAHSIGGGTIGE